VSCITLTCNVKRVFDEIPRIIIEKVGKEIDKMISCSGRVIDNFAVTID
jgi:hypothetical protein